MTNIVLPSDTNNFGNMFGGELLARMDRACCISACKHANGEVLTVSVNHVTFSEPIPIGSIVSIESKVSRAFCTSMEVFADVWIENIQNSSRCKAGEGIYTFVCVGTGGKPTKVPELIAESDLEKERFIGALRRKQLSLILAGKLSPLKADELKSLFL